MEMMKSMSISYLNRLTDTGVKAQFACDVRMERS